ncbi:uncharacterized protein [Epargyreus clarus]|uniref:uncharacterized protein n=1 Tax=Epargyreus clarus TaxID=520877 RepID=UPI003C2F47AD
MDGWALAGIIAVKIILFIIYIICRCTVCATETPKRNEFDNIPQRVAIPMPWPYTEARTPATAASPAPHSAPRTDTGASHYTMETSAHCHNRNEDRAVPSPRVYPMGYPETRGTPRPNTEAPHPTTGVPNPVTGVPHPMTGVPHPMTGEPNPMAGVPHPMTGVPHPMTGVPHLMAGVPSTTTGLPYSNTGPSSYSTESTHCADKPPSYEQAVKQSPYNADMLL